MSRLSDVDAFIDQSRNCDTADDLRGIMDAITREMGFHSYALLQHAGRFSWSDRSHLALSSYPLAWIEYFFGHGLDSDDPVKLSSRKTGLGFSFAEMPRLIQYTHRQRRVLDAARREGITDGFAVPLHIPGEPSGTCTFIVRNGAPLPDRSFAAAQLVGGFAYEAGRRLKQAGAPFLDRGIAARKSDRSIGSKSKRLTSRQLDCLMLVARGKTDWETARILGIAPETVKHHLRIVREHYGVTTRTQAAIRAILAQDVALSDLTT